MSKPAQPKKLSSHELKTISPDFLLGYLMDFKAYYKFANQEAEAAGDLPRDMKDCFIAFLDEISEITDPESKSYRDDHEDFLTEFEKKFMSSEALKSDRSAFNDAVDECTESLPEFVNKTTEVTSIRPKPIKGDSSQSSSGEVSPSRLSTISERTEEATRSPSPTKSNLNLSDPITIQRRDSSAFSLVKSPRSSGSPSPSA